MPILPDVLGLRARGAAPAAVVSRSVGARGAAEDVLAGVRPGVSAAAEGGGMIYPPNRALWITAGLLLCLLVVILTVLLMMARVVVA